MIRTADLVHVADLFRAATGVERESTLSHRVFGDGKIINNLRNGSDITLGRFNAAMQWFAGHWPDGAEVPEPLLRYRPPPAAPGPNTDEEKAA